MLKSGLIDEFNLDGTFPRSLIIGTNDKKRKIGLANAPNFSEVCIRKFLSYIGFNSKYGEEP